MPRFVKDGRFNFSENQDHVFIIAEIGVNHDGDRTKAVELTDLAKSCDADMVKFQAFDPHWLCNPTVAQAGYQLENQKGKREAEDGFMEMLHRYQMSRGQMIDVRRHCDRTDIGFLCTPFDVKSLRMLVDEVGVEMLKIGSGQLVHMPLLVEAGRSGLPVIISTGVSNLEEIGMALTWIAFGRTHKEGLPDASYVRMPTADDLAVLKDNVAIMQCTTSYPAPLEETNLNVITTLQDAFGLPVGFSDHTGTTNVMCGAVKLGARFLETHITYDVNAIGPDHKASHEKAAFRTYVANARAAVKKDFPVPDAAWGYGIKVCNAKEGAVHDIARNGLWAIRDIAPGEEFVLGENEADVQYKNANVKAVRSVCELTPCALTVLLGQKATKAIRAHAPIPADQIPPSKMKPAFLADKDPAGAKTRARIEKLHGDMGLVGKAQKRVG